jgi:hypothetical protein
MIPDSDELEQIPDDDGDPPDALEQMMKRIDASRSDCPLFIDPVDQQQPAR